MDSAPNVLNWQDYEGRLALHLGTRKWSVGNHMMGSGKWRLCTHDVCLCSFPCVAVADSDAAVVKALLKSEKCQINALDSNYRYDAVSIL